MKRKNITALLLACSMLTACGGGTELLTPTEGQVSDEEALWQFSYHMLMDNMEETNPVLSPVSAYLAMGMVGLGAKEDTLAEFEAVMGKGMQTISGGLMQKIPDWISKENSDEIKPLEVANSVWVDEKMKPDEVWLKSVSDIYAAEAYRTKLSAASAMKDINSWVEEKTNSLVKGFLSEPLDEETRLALFNTIYFKGKWVDTFEATSTYKEDFTTTAGEVKQVDMMHDYGRREFYIRNSRMDGVVMDYQNGSMALVALKPMDGQTVREMYEQLTMEELSELLDSGTELSIYLKLPKFEVEFDKKLNDTLMNMGIQRAFDANRADFTGLGITEDGYPLYISLVRQKAVVKLDEEGTEAAAVTMVAMVKCAAVEPVQKPVDVFFDEPFLYMIMDMESRTPLFMGIMDDPTK